MTLANKRGKEDQDQITFENLAKARRVVEVGKQVIQSTQVAVSVAVQIATPALVNRKQIILTNLSNRQVAIDNTIAVSVTASYVILPLGTLIMNVDEDVDLFAIAAAGTAALAIMELA